LNFPSKSIVYNFNKIYDLKIINEFYLFIANFYLILEITLKNQTWENIHEL